MPYPLINVFISSTIADLLPEREAIRTGILDLNTAILQLGVALAPIDLARGAATEPSLDVCLSSVKGSDLLILCMGHRYGSLAADGVSITEHEYRLAESRQVARLVYTKDPRQLVLPENIERDATSRAKLEQFKAGIDSSIKRDTFSSPADLRASVQRDVLAWLLSDPRVLTGAHTKSTADDFEVCRKYFELVAASRFAEAALILRSGHFEFSLSRLGLDSLYASMLESILELNKIGDPVQICNPQLRAGLLLDYLGATQGSGGSLATALAQAVALETKIADPRYSLKVSLATANRSTRARRKDLAIKHLGRSLRLVRTSTTYHDRIETCLAIAATYREFGQHGRAYRWYMKAISLCCAPSEFDAFCATDAFIGAGASLIAMGSCTLANDRLGKALMLARAIPSPGREATALDALASHFEHHGRLDAAVAAYVLIDRIAASNGPRNRGGPLGELLGEFIARHGYAAVSESLSRVTGDPKRIVDQELSPYELEKFVSSLGSMYRGDHK